MRVNQKIEEVKTLISDMSVSDKKVREIVENLTDAPQEDNEEIVSLLKEKRPSLYSEWMLEIASEYM